MAYHGIPTKAIHEQWLGLVQPSDYGETLRSAYGVSKLEGEGLQAPVLDLTPPVTAGMPRRAV